MMRYMTVLCVIILIFGASMLAAQDNEELDLPITENVTYVVATGDTLDLIAVLFDVQLACLRETNDLVPADILSTGDELLISVDCPAYDGILDVAIPRENTPGSGADGSYVVQPNDTLDTIGQELNISVEAIILANDIDNPGKIFAGDVLVIPSGPEYGVFPALDGGAGAGGGADGELYIVQPRDTLDEIGQEFDVSVVSLMLVNEIERGIDLVPGQTIVIPDDAPAYGQFPATDGGVGAGGGLSVDGEIYVVQPNDTLDTIAQEFDVSVIYLEQVNNLENPGKIFAGQSILIPDDSPAYGQYPATDGGLGAGGGADGEIYVVQLRETIDGISADFNKSYLCVLEANNITNPRTLQAGTTIVIPDSCPPYVGFDIVPVTIDPNAPANAPAEDMDANSGTEDGATEDEGDGVVG